MKHEQRPSSASNRVTPPHRQVSVLLQNTEQRRSETQHYNTHLSNQATANERTASQIAMSVYCIRSPLTIDHSCCHVTGIQTAD